MAFAQNLTYNQYHLNNALKTILTTDSQSGGNGVSFVKVASRDDWWDWTQGHLMDTLYADKRLNNNHDAKV